MTIRIGELITIIADTSIFLLVGYCILTTLAIIIIILNRRDKLYRYMQWKTSTIDFIVYKKTYERNDDWLYNELFEENNLLLQKQKELNLVIEKFKKSNSSLSFRLVFSILLIIIILRFKRKML